MARFLKTKYESDAGGVYNIRVSANTAGLTENTPPAGIVTDSHVDVSVGKHGQKRKSGIHARGVILERFTGTGDARKRYTTFLPVLDPTSMPLFTVGFEVVLGATIWNVSGDVAEV